MWYSSFVYIFSLKICFGNQDVRIPTSYITTEYIVVVVFFFFFAVCVKQIIGRFIKFPIMPRFNFGVSCAFEIYLVLVRTTAFT